MDRADLAKKDGGSTTTRSHAFLSPGPEASAFAAAATAAASADDAPAKASTSAFKNVAAWSRPLARAFLVAVRTALAALSTCRCPAKKERVRPLATPVAQYFHPRRAQRSAHTNMCRYYFCRVTRR